MIFKRILIISIASIFISGCYKLSGPKKPKDLISKDKMVDVLLEIRLMSSATGVNQTKLHQNGISSYQYIYDKYDIDSAQFASSNDYYAFYVDDYDEIYERVRDSLQALKEKFDELKEIEKKEKIKQDSIKTITRKDSLRLLKNTDSLEIQRQRDSIEKQLLKNKKEGLIEPVSDTDFPDPQ